MTFEPNQEFSHFRILRKIGEGGMGEVYLAEDQKLGRSVAIKILQSEFFDSPDRLERFSREAKTAARISHSNVMSIYDIGSDVDVKSGKQISYIVMEHVTGVSLTEYLATGSPPMKDLLRVAEKTAAGLAAAHKLGIVHRDIKTDNIKIDESGEPKILDFGLAKPVSSPMSDDIEAQGNTVSKELTQEGKILGTVTYMSPEQARGENVDSRSDIFSFGTMLYKMFTGTNPFESNDRISTLAKILESKHVPMRQKNEAIPPELERIVDKCLQKDPNDRYQDTRDLVVDLRTLRRQFESGLSDSSSLETDAAALRRKSGSRLISRVWPFAAVVVLGLAAYGLISKFVGSDSSRTGVLQAKGNSLAILSFENKTGDSELDWLTSGLPEILMTDLAESRSVDLINRNRILDYLEDEGNGEQPSHKESIEAARALGASKVLSGAFYKLGDKIRIDARLEDVESGKILLGEKVVGPDPFILVDSLTQKIGLSLNLKELAAGNVQVAEITSSSPEAYKHYILGTQQFWLDYDLAIGHFKKAIEIDSSFALPYLRIGMRFAYRGRTQQAAPYFQAASRFADNLPVKERSMLDIYRDIWFNANFDDAMIKCAVYLGNYPDDLEMRSFYALMLHSLQRKSQEALAQLDTVIMTDPHSSQAFLFLSSIHNDLGNRQKAIEYAERSRNENPGSRDTRAYLVEWYFQASRFDDVIRECESLLEMSPGDESVLSDLVRVYVFKRDFDSARRYAELIRQHNSGDPYSMMRYYGHLAELSNWQGKFMTAAEYLKNSLAAVKTTGDSILIARRYSSIASLYVSVDMRDSASAYCGGILDYASRMEEFNYAMMLISIDPAKEGTARPIFERGVDDFRRRVPSDMWGLTDALESVFDGMCRSDTALIIAGYDSLIGMGQLGSENYSMLGKTLVLTGRYDRGKETLQNLLSGDDATSNAFDYLTSVYYTAIANQALGNDKDAIAGYQEVIKYWGNPDIELKEIADTRARLRGLTS
jgi:serine/threonine protein kinase